jgi:hypothetical protein
MKRSVIFLMLAAALTLTSCDFMRKMSGRPTKEELKMLKGEIERIDQLRQEEARVRANIDSLEQVRKSLEESMAVANVPVAPKPAVDNSKYLTKNLENRYYVIIGAFRTRSNAEALFNKAESAGYKPVLISFRNGLLAVGLSPADECSNAMEMIKSIRQEPFCPAYVWILVNE